MLGGEGWKKVRKGTKSCTECRRRKTRCIQVSENAQTCRRCEERGSECIAQAYNSRPQARRQPSRYRISQLESQVASLTGIVHGIESELSHQPIQTLKPSLEQSPRIEGSDHDDDSSISDILVADQPSHLRSLFQNDCLSLDASRQNEQLEDRRAKASAHLLDTARRELQKLIPSKDEVSDIAGSASKWLTLIHTMMPHPFTARSRQEIVGRYESMRTPGVDAISLALWLLTIAVTAQQIPEKDGSPQFQSRRSQGRLRFSSTVAYMVETMILSHDRLIGTAQGLAMAMQFIRLQVSQGSFQRAWVRLRHVIAVAELMGLPKASRIAQLKKAAATDEETQLQMTQLWEMICTVEGLLGMTLNLSPSTRRYHQPKDQALAIDGVVQPRVYLIRLTDIATRVHDLDDMNTAQGQSTELYTSALDLDRELRELASQTPKSWWAGDLEQVRPDHVVQFLHYSITMRVHLHFTIRHSGEEYDYSRLTCMNACESVAQRYQFLRRILPPGIFLSGILDLQVFAATVILLLTSHSLLPMDHCALHIDKTKIQSVVAEVINVMCERSNETCSSGFAQTGATALSSLNKLLQQDEHAAVPELTLNVPLLGNLHIRRNIPPAHKVDSPQCLPSNSGLPKPSECSFPQGQGPTSLKASTDTIPTTPTRDDWQWDNFSWSIENSHENLFQDILMSTDFDQFAMPDNAYDNLSLDG